MGGMNKRVVWGIVGGIVVALLLVVTITNAIRSGNATPEPTSTSSGGGIIDPGDLTPPSPTPSTTLEPQADQNKGAGDALGAEGDFSSRLPAFVASAEGFLTQYLQWDSNESADARAARIAPFVDAGSPLLTQTPGISLKDRNGGYDYKSQTKVTWIDHRYSGWTLPDNAKDTSLYITVSANYSISQSGSAGTQNSFWESGGHYTVEFSGADRSGNPKVIGVQEPEYLPPVR